MRILVLLDDVADLDGPVQVEDERGFVKASARRDVQVLIPRLDPGRVQPEIYALPDGAQTLSARGWLNWSLWRQLVRLLRDHDIELIHALGMRATMYTVLAARYAGLPTIASCYAVSRSSGGRTPRRLLQRLQYRLMRFGIDRVIVPSDLIRRA